MNAEMAAVRVEPGRSNLPASHQHGRRWESTNQENRIVFDGIIKGLIADGNKFKLEAKDRM